MRARQKPSAARPPRRRRELSALLLGEQLRDPIEGGEISLHRAAEKLLNLFLPVFAGGGREMRARQKPSAARPPRLRREWSALPPGEQLQDKIEGGESAPHGAAEKLLNFFLLVFAGGGREMRARQKPSAARPPRRQRELSALLPGEQLQDPIEGGEISPDRAAEKLLNLFLPAAAKK